MQNATSKLTWFNERSGGKCWPATVMPTTGDFGSRQNSTGSTLAKLPRDEPSHASNDIGLYRMQRREANEVFLALYVSHTLEPTPTVRIRFGPRW